MFVKKTLVTLVALGLSVPVFAIPSTLHIQNNTKRDSTTITNGGACSSALGEVGITRSGKGNDVPIEKVGQACSASIIKKTDCKADVYMTDKCNIVDRSAKPIGTVYFDIQKKDGKYYGEGLVQSKTVIHDSSYSVGGKGFDLSINGGPATLAKN